MSSPSFSFRVIGLAAAGAVVVGIACSVATAQPPTAPAGAAGADLPEVPQGTVEEVFEYLLRIVAVQPAPGDEEVVRTFRLRQMQRIVTASERILAGEPNPEQAAAAAMWKVRALTTLGQLGDGAAAEALARFPGELEKAGRGELARQVRSIQLQIRLRGLRPTETAEMKTLLTDIEAYLAAGDIASRDVSLARQAAWAMESSGNKEMAVAACRSLGKILADSDDLNIARVGEKLLGGARRLTLVGSPMTIAGTAVDGTPLDWSAYKGKVVLVMFWASWCGPCRAEIPNVKKHYEAYHGRGFDVVGISCDEQRDAVEGFIKQVEIPWKILYSGDPDANGMNHPMAVHFGVTAIPQMILVGTDGRGVAIDVRGPRLGRELEKLLGPLEMEGEGKPE